MNKNNNKQPVILLGGSENALSIGRSLGRRGIPMYVAAAAESTALNSKYFKEKFVCPAGQDIKSFWQELLFSPDSAVPEGCIVYPCMDESLEFFVTHADALKQRYTVYDFKPELIDQLLDKQRTIELSRQVGCPAPNFWSINTPGDVESISDVTFPVMIKPIHSHLFQKIYNKKLLIIEKADDLERTLEEIMGHNLKVMLCEIIPGPDTLLSSYYTYIDPEGNTLFHFTKRVIRRNPVNYGGGCYHIAKWEPKTAEMGLRFFEGLDFQGLGNIEFKFDERDQQLKVIESNTRFTAAQELLNRCGMDISYIIYCYLTKQPIPDIKSYKQGVRLWYPMKDFRSFRQLRRRGEITLGQWLLSIARPQNFSRFSLTDPNPSIQHFLREWNDRK